MLFVLEQKEIIFDKGFKKSFSFDGDFYNDSNLILRYYKSRDLIKLKKNKIEENIIDLKEQKKEKMKKINNNKLFLILNLIILNLFGAGNSQGLVLSLIEKNIELDENIIKSSYIKDTENIKAENNIGFNLKDRSIINNNNDEFKNEIVDYVNLNFNLISNDINKILTNDDKGLEAKTIKNNQGGIDLSDFKENDILDNTILTRCGYVSLEYVILNIVKDLIKNNIRSYKKEDIEKVKENYKKFINKLSTEFIPCTYDLEDIEGKKYKKNEFNNNIPNTFDLGNFVSIFGIENKENKDSFINFKFFDLYQEDKNKSLIMSNSVEGFKYGIFYNGLNHYDYLMNINKKDHKVSIIDIRGEYKIEDLEIEDGVKNLIKVLSFDFNKKSDLAKNFDPLKDDYFEQLKFNEVINNLKKVNYYSQGIHQSEEYFLKYICVDEQPEIKTLI